jgi:glycopeptide antibiotics resistance protein
VAPVLLGMILAVELLQPLLRVGFLDVDDVILNFAGAMVGVGVVRIPAVNRLLRKLYVWKEPEMQAVHKGQDL